ncbi:hypothetical protein MYXO_00327 [Myxococcaceae bacterium]|jgi:1-acyl-sn-glycerol-3-phosphate acyltransferase|nr:hypothetical protein MYXO_00327 [Myxococcaceae bacterium]
MVETMREPRASRWIRRSITLPLYVFLLGTLLVLLPVLLAAALGVDAVRRRRFATTRCLLFLVGYLACEVAGLVASLALWLAAPFLGALDSKRSQDLHYRLQGWWAATLYRLGAVLYGLESEVEELGEPGRGPIVLLTRHASVGDTVVPAVFLANRHGLHLRYVLKRELLWDPCLDVVGNRLPNYFVRRGSGDTAREADGVARLLDGLGPRDGVLIYPEGTRFTPAKREQVLARLSKGSEAHLVSRAAALTHVLPPRLGGALALLERNPGADVVFCAHVGFDRASTFWHFWNGDLVGETIHVRFWRVPFAEIPKDRDGRIDWILSQWERVDAYVRERRGGGE